MGWKAPTSSSRDYEGGPVGLSRTRSGNDIEYFDGCRPGIWAQGPHQSKRTDAERRERVVDPGSGPKVRISPRELMRREERELSTQDLGPRPESSVSTGSDKKKECAAGVPASPHSQSSHVRSRSLHLVPNSSLKLTLRRSGTLAIALSRKHGLQTMKC